MIVKFESCFQEEENAKIKTVVFPYFPQNTIAIANSFLIQSACGLSSAGAILPQLTIAFTIMFSKFFIFSDILGWFIFGC